MPDDDGYGQVGGNGSVEWTLDIKNKRFASSVDVPPNGLRQTGVDNNGRPGDVFTLSIEMPEKMASIEAFRKYLTTPKNWQEIGRCRLAIKIPIEAHNPDQIKVSWPSRGKRRRR